MSSKLLKDGESQLRGEKKWVDLDAEKKQKTVAACLHASAQLLIEILKCGWSVLLYTEKWTKAETERERDPIEA